MKLRYVAGVREEERGNVLRLYRPPGVASSTISGRFVAESKWAALTWRIKAVPHRLTRRDDVSCPGIVKLCVGWYLYTCNVVRLIRLSAGFYVADDLISCAWAVLLSKECGIIKDILVCVVLEHVAHYRHCTMCYINVLLTYFSSVLPCVCLSAQRGVDWLIDWVRRRGEEGAGGCRTQWKWLYQVARHENAGHKIVICFSIIVMLFKR